MYYKFLTFSILFLLSSIFIYTQNINGTVTDVNQFPLAGVAVVNTNSQEFTETDFGGKFQIKAQIGDVLYFSSIGFKNQEVKISTNYLLTVVLQDDVESLDEVVVTALGIKREKKALGYATQEIKSDDINQTHSNNFANALTGKIAGVQITGSGNGLTSSSRITIRGERSLVLDNNSPLIILDGIPLNDTAYGVGGGSTNQSNMPADYGTGLADINQDDIESINVLKGAAAAALYGSRAANGVILITTKSGNFNDKVSINFSSSTMMSDPLRLWDVQDQYGAGVGGVYEPGADTNFGPKLDGTASAIQNGSPGYYPSGNVSEMPLLFRYNLNDFFQTGQSFDNAIDLDGGSEKFSYRFGYNNTRSTGIVPNTDLNKNNFSLKTDYKINSKWKFNTYLSYIKTDSDNVLVSGYGSQGIMYNLIWNHTNVDLDWMKDYWYVKDQEQKRMFTWGDNIFKLAYENINAFDKNRLMGTINSTYNFTDHLSLMARISSDYFNDFRMSRRPVGSSRYPSGQYREQSIDFRETNADVLVTFEKNNELFSGKLSLGGNIMKQFTTENFIEGKGLSIPGYYNLQNVNVTPSMYRNKYEKQINSLYAFANIGYKNYVFLDLTARNDWSSTLPTENNSYFYPSVSLSFIPSTAFKLSEKINYLKLRLNYASVGNDTDPYKLKSVYNNATLPGSLTNSTQLLNADLKPELNNSFEAGMEWQLFKNRISFDISYYNTQSKNQILGISLSETTGFYSKLINAGLIKNWGTEIMLGIKPIKNDKIEWNLQVNFAKNESKVIELSDGLDNYIIAYGPNGGRIEARVGGKMGDIYGYGYLRNPDGKIIYDSSGSPMIDPEIKNWGNYNPDWTLGFSSMFKVKNISLYTLLDYRKGGVIYSMTHSIGMESGLLVGSLPGRETGIIGDGVVLNSDGTYSPNTTVTSPELWYYDNVYTRGNIEANSFDATYLKLRELSINYSIPVKWIKHLKMEKASIALVGNNLALWTDVPHIDPETQSLEGGRLTPGFEVMQLPSTKNYGIKLNLNF